MAKKKYKLVNKESFIPHSPYWNGDKRTFYRLLALRDIPKHGVKKGDLGGRVTSKKILSHEGSCWVAYGAIIQKNVRISGDAYIGDYTKVVSDFNDSMITITDNVRILDKAHVSISKEGTDPDVHLNISGNATICDHATILSANNISDNATIAGEVFLRSADTISGNSIIRGKAEIKKGASVKGDSKVCDNAVIKEKATITDTIVSGYAQIGKKQTFSGQNFDQRGIFVNTEEALDTIAVSSIGNITAQTPTQDATSGATASIENNGVNIAKADPMDVTHAYFQEVKTRISVYETDIVKIIKYPLMTDKTNPYTRDMALALNKAERLSRLGNVKDFEEAIEVLEAKFIEAESNAVKSLSTGLNEDELKKTATAKQLLSLAGNEASSENERKTAFTQGFKQLEGVITVPEVAVDTFRIKIGLKELEA